MRNLCQRWEIFFFSFLLFKKMYRGHSSSSSPAVYVCVCWDHGDEIWGSQYFFVKLDPLVCRSDVITLWFHTKPIFKAALWNWFPKTYKDHGEIPEIVGHWVVVFFQLDQRDHGLAVLFSFKAAFVLDVAVSLENLNTALMNPVMEAWLFVLQLLHPTSLSVSVQPGDSLSLPLFLSLTC